MRKPLEKADFAGYRPGHRTALKKVRQLGSARSGTEHFLQQRITAAANFLLVLVLAVVAVALSGRTYEEAVALVGSVWVAVPLALALVSVCIHFKLGVQVVIEDYVHSDLARITLLLLLTFFAIAVAGLGLYAILRIVFAASALPG